MRKIVATAVGILLANGIQTLAFGVNHHTNRHLTKTVASVKPLSEDVHESLLSSSKTPRVVGAPPRMPSWFKGMLLAGSLSLSTIMGSTMVPAVANAVDSRVIGELQGSGLVFKDTLLVESFDDPKVKGVTLYISNFQRPLSERLSKDFFSDPSYASVGCAKTGPVSIADNIAKGKAGEEVFEESRSLLFKTLRVQRLYDQEKHTVVYVSFNTRLDKNSDSNKSRFKSSICAVNLD